MITIRYGGYTETSMQMLLKILNSGLDVVTNYGLKCSAESCDNCECAKPCSDITRAVRHIEEKIKAERAKTEESK